MALSESALLLTGFVLAHAAWSICDDTQLLVPLAISERNGKREVSRFEANTQEEAIDRGKAAMANLGASVDAWAFAREGLLSDKRGKVDVLSIDIGAKGTSDRVTLIQQFEPYSKRHHFRLIGDPEVAIGGSIQEPAAVKDLLSTVRRGISQHSKAAPLWDGWHRP